MNHDLIHAVEAILRNKSVGKKLPLDISPTPFQGRAWKTSAGIPFGQTRIYGDVARGSQGSGPGYGK